MSDEAAAAAPQRGPGSIVWTDLTVPDADPVRDFYRAVVDWETEDVEMGGYADYAMRPAGAASRVAGVCHRRGVNADLPAQWLIYIAVDDLDASLARCRERGGELIAGPRAETEGARFAVIRDPAGAVAALIESSGEAGAASGEAT